MRIVSIVAGAGEMYCGACLHSSRLVAALRRAGEDALLVPAYTPVRVEDDEAVVSPRIVFGGLNVYLQEKLALARYTPAFLDRVLDHPALLRWLGRSSGGTRPERLGALCVSMLQGEEGRQRKELRKLIEWLRHDLRPDVVHLSTALLAGMAGPIAHALDVSVVATLAGEDMFVDRLLEPYRSQARDVMGRACRQMAALVALNRYYAEFMASYLNVDRERIHVIEPGLHVAKIQTRSAPSQAKKSGGPTIGFFSRICPDKGLHVLADAFVLLHEAMLADDPTSSELLPLRAAGYLADADRPYLAEIASRLAARGLGSRFQYLGCLTREEKLAFLESVDVLCLPSVLPESKGLPVLEAWACGVPVIVSDHGAFAELVRETGGGLLVEPGNAASLASAIRRLVRDPREAATLGRQGQAAVRSRYTSERMARDMIALYRRLRGLGEGGDEARRCRDE